MYVFSEYEAVLKVGGEAKPFFSCFLHQVFDVFNNFDLVY